MKSGSESDINLNIYTYVPCAYSFYWLLFEFRTAHLSLKQKVLVSELRDRPFKRS